MCCFKNWIRLGAVFAGLAVVAGAYASHGLDRFLLKLYGSEQREVAGAMIPAAQKHLADFKTGAEYQMYHALALIAVGLLERFRPSRWLTLSGWLFVGGIFMFSGGLYVLSVTGQRWIGAKVVPLGGLMYIAGWFALALAARPSGCGPAKCSSADDVQTLSPDV